MGTTKTYIVYGKTYHVRQTIKEQGGKWDKDRKVWIIESDHPPVLPDGIKCAVRGEYLDTCEKCGREFDMPGFTSPKRDGCVFCHE